MNSWNDPQVHDDIRSQALNGSSYVDEVPFGQVQNGRGWTESRFEEFAARYRVVYHQPDLASGFSATLFYDTQEDRYTVAFRGSNQPYPDIAPSDLLLTLGLSSLDPGEQYSAVRDFFQHAGLLDEGGAVRPEFAGQVDFVGHSLGGFLSLWAVYEFRELFSEVYTFNGAGISALPGTPDYDYIARLVQTAPLSAVQLGCIRNYFAEEGIEVASNDFTFFRPGSREGIFVERRDLLGSVGFHSMSLLADSMAVHSLLAMVDPEIGFAAATQILYGMSNESVGSLDLTIARLSDLVSPASGFASIGDVEAFRQEIIGISADGASLGCTIELLLDRSPGEIAALAGDDSASGRGYRYALAGLLPFAVTAGPVDLASDGAGFDPEQFSGNYLADRALFLATLLRMNTADRVHGDLKQHAYFSDLQYGIGFNSDAITYGAPGEISDLRARLAFGSEADDVGTLAASSQDDSLYGMDGNDVISGLAGSDYLEGGEGNDSLSGGEGGDILVGGRGADALNGGAGDDILVGGPGADTYIWDAGGGRDVIGDADDGGDRILIDGSDLSTLQFTQVAPGLPYYRDPDHPGIDLHYDGAGLAISVAGGAAAGGLDVQHYAPDANFGIALGSADPEMPGTDLEVAFLGPGPDETDPSAFWREQSAQGGRDWWATALHFDAAAVANYTPGTLHGTLGGAFEGGPVDDYLTGDAGSNALHGLAGDDLLEGLDGDDFLEGGAGSDRLVGGDGNDLLFGTARAGLLDELDESSAYGQFYLAQSVEESGSSNILDGGAGDDLVSGGAYRDYLEGGPGSDYLLGGSGPDLISGGSERDIIYGDSSLNYRLVESAPGIAVERVEIAFADEAAGPGECDDIIHAGAGDDTVWGELGADEIHGGAGDDNLIGDRYDDQDYFSGELAGYGASTPALNSALHEGDRLYGDAGRDLLLGLGGDDFLAGGTDADSLVGGAGDDTYFFRAGDGLDHIEDSEGMHTLVFSGIPAADLQVLFQGEQVFIGTGYGAEGLYLSRSEWASVQVALETTDALQERSRLDTLYLDGSGHLLLTVKGIDGISETDLQNVLAVDVSDPDRPRLVVGGDAEAVEIKADAVGGATMRVIGRGFGPLLVELTAAQIATGMDFLDVIDGVSMSLLGFSGDLFGSGGDDHIVGSSGPDTIYGLAGGDLLEGRGGNDTLDGGSGDDLLRGEAGDDVLRGGSGSDVLDGGPGDDELDGGGQGNEVYYFDAADGVDRLIGSSIGTLVFGPDVDPDSVIFYYTGTSDAAFRIEYGAGSALVSQGAASSYWLQGLAVNGAAIPLVQRSDLVDGTFRDTRWDDVFEPGDGNDRLLVAGWGSDVLRFAAGTGQDTVEIDNGFYPQQTGEIRLAADVDPGSVSFAFAGGSAVISYGLNSRVTLTPDTVFTARDNAFTRFTLVSEADPDWIPVIRAEGYVGNLYGSFGDDIIVSGPHVETVLPGYGNDAVKTGDGPDRIVLNDLYIAGEASIGHKDLWGEGDNDILETPLYQGMTFHYGQGDGNDTIQYDWSYSPRHPYRFSVDAERNVLVFEQGGEDSIAFGPGIALSDLRFVRAGEALTISLFDGTGSIRVENFFAAYDGDVPAWNGDVSQLVNGDTATVPDSLTHPALLAALPRTPVASLRFADGEVYDMVDVLDSFLETSMATVIGTEGPDYLVAEGGDVVDALGGDDMIEAFNGDNTIQAGAGNDDILVSGDSIVDPGPGFDWVNLVDGDHVVHFGPGSGFDTLIVAVESATARVQMATGVTLADIEVTLVDSEWGQVPLISLPQTGDHLRLATLSYDAQAAVWQAAPNSAVATLVFADGTEVSGSELYHFGESGPGQTLTGSAGSDMLVGTERDDVITGGAGDDFMDGRGGNDLFLIEGRREGNDTIVGGAGLDTIAGGALDDRITLTRLTAADSIEIVDGGAGRNTIAGTGSANSLDFSITELLGINAIDGRGGDDLVTGSSGADSIKGGAGDDILSGGFGNDTLRGNAGDDTYIFGAGDGSDVIVNADGNVDSFDRLVLEDAQFDAVWLSRRNKHLLVTIGGTDDQILVKNWYGSEGAQLDAIYADDHVLLRTQVDQLVTAMAQFDVPQGAGAIIPEQVRAELEPVLSSVWQLTG